MAKCLFRSLRLASTSLLALTVLGGAVQALEERSVENRFFDSAVTAAIPGSGLQAGPPSTRFPELGALREAADLYRRGDLAGGDILAGRIRDSWTRRTAEWIAIRTAGRSVGFDRLSNFLNENPDVPTRKWLLKKAEDALLIERAKGERVLHFFAGRAPEGPSGRAVLASAMEAAGDKAAAKQLALAAYRDRSTTRDVAEYLEKAFPDAITQAEQALRAHRLILNNQKGEGLRLAGKLGTEQRKLAEALAVASGKGQSTSILDGVSPALKTHSSYKLALAQILRRQNRLSEARDALNSSPHDPELLADADEWWTERRVLARKLLDAGDAAGAYRVVAEHSALSVGRKAEAEFHAGWIALRYLNFPQTGIIHFNESARHAELMAARSRAAYWQGRAMEAGAVSEMRDAHAAYAISAAHPATYYGQLAAGKLGREALRLPVTEASEVDESLFLAGPAGQMLHRLFDAGLQELALPMAVDFARIAPSASQVDIVADRFAAAGNASAVLAIGRMATSQGFALEQHAFPTFGIPRYEPLPGSQEKAMVYAIARQESAFNPKAVSTADARGLMQMLPSTAARTARRFNQPFSPNRLTEDPAFCAMLGAAHLGELMEETKGSIVMTFASYNAGGKRVREWIAAFGDPRDPQVDVVDWVERIPFYETRHYVQKIMENLQVYRARFGGDRSALLIGADMERGRRN